MPWMPATRRAVAALMAILVLSPAAVLASSIRVTEGDARAIFRAFPNGGWAVILNGGTVEEPALADFLVDSMARISPSAGWDGRHFCSLDWHVINVVAIEGNPAGGTRTNAQLIETLSQIEIDITLDGAHLDSMRTAIARTTNPQLRGYVEAFWVGVGQVMAPEDLAVGQHSVQFTGRRPGQPPMIMDPVTFFIDAAGEGACV